MSGALAGPLCLEKIIIYQELQNNGQRRITSIPEKITLDLFFFLGLVYCVLHWINLATMLLCSCEPLVSLSDLWMQCNDAEAKMFVANCTRISVPLRNISLGLSQ